MWGDGLHATFELLETAAGLAARQLVETRVLRGLSMGLRRGMAAECRCGVTPRNCACDVESAAVLEVSLVRRPAFPAAGVRSTSSAAVDDDSFEVVVMGGDEPLDGFAVGPRYMPRPERNLPTFVNVNQHNRELYGMSMAAVHEDVAAARRRSSCDRRSSAPRPASTMLRRCSITSRGATPMRRGGRHEGGRASGRDGALRAGDGTPGRGRDAPPVVHGSGVPGVRPAAFRATDARGGGGGLRLMADDPTPNRAGADRLDGVAPVHEPVDVTREMAEAAEPPPERITRPTGEHAVTPQPDRTPYPDRITRPSVPATTADGSPGLDPSRRRSRRRPPMMRRCRHGWKRRRTALSALSER